MEIKLNNIEYTNLISEGQEVERFVGLISPLDVIGYPFDYSGQAISEVNRKTNEAFDLLHEYLLGEDVHRAHFSFLSFNVKSLDFVSIENIMRQHKFTSIVYDLSKRYSDILTVKYDRVYYTRLYNNKETDESAFKGLTRTEMNKMAFPTDTNGDDPSARVKRGEFGSMMACEKIRLIDSMNKTYGHKFDKESVWTYVLHVDFQVYFNFNNLRVLQYAMKSHKWTGALLTFINWTARHKANLKKNWEYSERWYIDYAEYQCARNISWYDLKEGDGQCVHIRMPYTFGYWEQYCKPHLTEEELIVANNELTDNNNTVSVTDNSDNVKNENISSQNVNFKRFSSFYINKTIKKENNINTVNRNIHSDIITSDDLHPPD